MKEEEIIQLEKQVAELMTWKKYRENERLVYPIDSQSKKTLRYWHTRNFDGLPIVTGNTFSIGDSLLTDLLAFAMEIMVNGQKRKMLVTFALNQFTANAGTDTLTNTTGSHNLNNGDRIAMVSTNTLPSPLDTITIYYVINRTSTTFQVSLTSGGSAIDITTAGIGTHYYGKP